MGDVCEWSAVYDCRNMLQSLYQVWFQSVFQQCAHCTLCVQIACGNRFLLGSFSISISDYDSCKSFFQVFDVACQTQNCHDLGSNGDVIAVLTRHSVCLSAQSVYYETKLTVIHIHTSSPGYFSWVDVQFISLINMVVDHCCQQVVGCADCVEVTGEMKVDILHGNYLCVSAACCPAFYTKYRSKGWLTKSNHNVFA